MVGESLPVAVPTSSPGSSQTMNASLVSLYWCTQTQTQQIKEQLFTTTPCFCNPALRRNAAVTVLLSAGDILGLFSHLKTPEHHRLKRVFVAQTTRICIFSNVSNSDHSFVSTFVGQRTLKTRWTRVSFRCEVWQSLQALDRHVLAASSHLNVSIRE